MNKLILCFIFMISFLAFATEGKDGSVTTGGGSTGMIQSANDETVNIGMRFKRLTSSSRRYTNRNTQAKSLLNGAAAIEACEDPTPVCDVITPEPADHLKFGISFIKKFKQTQKLAAGPKNCKCLSDKLQSSQTDKDFLDAKEKERKVVNETILKSYGKKFVNQFAGNLEDMSFFLRQTRDMFSNDSTAIDLQCMYPEKFDSKITETCGKKKITDQNFIDNRKDLFINALTGENTPFQYRMPAMASDILDGSKANNFEDRFTGPQQNTTTNSSKLSRAQYDQLRMDLAIRDPQAKFMDSLIGSLLKDPSYNSQLSEAIKSGFSPYEAIVNVVGKNEKNLVITEENKKYIENAAALEDSLKFFMMVHPGIGMALSDAKAFENVRKVVKPGSTETFVNTLNNKKNVLEPILVERCNTMIEEFAKAVCTPDEEVIASVDSDDLEVLLHYSDATAPVVKNREPVLNDLLICEARVVRNTIANTLGMFAGITGNDGSSVRDSDYIANVAATRTGNKVGGSLMGQISIAAANDSKIRAEIGEAIDRNNRVRKGISGPGVLADKVFAEQVLKGSVMELGSSAMTKDEAKKIVADNKKWEATRSSEVAGNGSVQKPSSTQVAANESEAKSQTGTQGKSQSQNLVAPQANPVIAPNYSNVQAPVASSTSLAAAQSRDQLRQYLAQKNDPTESSKAVTALDDSSVQELNKLRNERQALLEQQLKDGEAKLKDLRSQFTDVASKVKAPVADRNIASVDEDNADFEPRSFGRNPTSIDQRTSLGGGSIGGGQISSNAGAASTGGTKSGSVVASNKISKEASETEAQVTSSSNDQGTQTDVSGSIVITSAGVKSSESLPAQELNQEVQKFLAGTDLKAASIDDIKSKGIKIRFNVMENNQLVQKEMVVKYDSLDQETRNQIDLKFARNNVRNQVSKLAVLRMLIKQNKSL